MLEHLRLLFEFERWANRRCLASIAAAGERGASVRLFLHILAAQKVWLTRLQGQDSNHLPIWPTATLEQCQQEIGEREEALDCYLSGLTEADLAKPIAYRNQTGTAYEQTPLEILTHLGLHSQHHRGQIALQLRQLGAEPAVTDFIAFRRES